MKTKHKSVLYYWCIVMVIIMLFNLFILPLIYSDIEVTPVTYDVFLSAIENKLHEISE